MIQMFSLINILNCLPPPFSIIPCSVCSEPRTYTDPQFFYYYKNNHKINIALTVDIRALDCKYIFLSFLKTMTALTMGGGGGGERGDGGCWSKMGQSFSDTSKFVIHYFQFFNFIVYFFNLNLVWDSYRNQPLLF